MHEVHKSQRRRRHERHTDEAMGDPAMMLQRRKRALQGPEHVDIGGFGGEHHGQRRQSALAVESGASHAAAGQEMSERIQVFPRMDLLCSKRAIVRRWSESSRTAESTQRIYHRGTEVTEKNRNQLCVSVVDGPCWRLLV